MNGVSCPDAVLTFGVRSEQRATAARPTHRRLLWMTTRSGRLLHEMSDEREARDGDAVANLMKVLLEDCQRREEEAARWKQQLQQHMETLLKMVQTLGVREEPGTRHQSLGGNSGLDNYKLSRLTEADDIEAYLTTFERVMGAYSMAKEWWLFQLAPQLTGNMPMLRCLQRQQAIMTS